MLDAQTWNYAHLYMQFAEHYAINISTYGIDIIGT